MNFLNDLGRVFQSAGQTINDEIIKPAEATLNPKNTGQINAFDPNKASFNNAFDPNKNGFTNAFNPNKNGLKVALDNLETQLQKIDPNKNGVSNALTPIKTGLLVYQIQKKLKLKLIKS